MSLYLRTTGNRDGIPLIILHGLFGSGDNWLTVARELPERYYVILPDLPNHGDSMHQSRATYPQMAQAVAEVAAQLNRPPVVAGHSMGGKVAMYRALMNPDAVAALISFDMAPRAYRHSHNPIFSGLRSLEGQDGLVHVDSRREADERLAEHIPERAIRAFLLKNLVPHEDAYRWRLNLPVLERDYQRIVGWDTPAAPAGTGGSPQFSGPTLFVGGKNSDYLDPERDGGTITSLFPRARIEMIADAGHWIHADQRRRLVELTTAFLETAVQ